MIAPVHSAAGCEDYDRVEDAPAAELFQVMLTCDVVNSHSKAIVMLIVGQVRGLVDISLFPPAADSDKEIVGSLYGAIYYKYGGLGPDSVYTDDEKYTQLIGSLTDWRPGDLSDYEPGWNYSSVPTHEDYRSRLNADMQRRIERVREQRRFLQNDEFRVLSKEFSELQRKHNSTYKHGSAESIRSTELIQRMNELRKEIRGQPQDAT